MWRSIYFSKLPGMEKKVRVALDWAIDLFFPRDIVLTSSTDTILPHIIGTAEEPVAPQNQPQTDIDRERPQ